jgi:Zn-dependent protease with chaperone function
MDFFEAQEAARRKTIRLVVLYIVAVILIIICVYAAAVLILFFTGGKEAPPIEWWHPEILVAAGGGVLALVSAGSLFKTASLKSGGGAVARMLGGRLVEPNTSDASERLLVNVVEEMAIASGVRVPEIYILPEEGINAFAAGFSTDDAVVAVTDGCLKALNRDQLQGVIAHEFSHILNGDMRLNIRLIGLLFGILLLGLTGQILLRSITRATMFSGRRRNNKAGGIVVVIALLGLVLIVIGYVGVFFGRLIQSAVSRQREYLADASAVQFTRNPGGVSGALKQIGAYRPGSALNNNHATETSHLFFANGVRSSFLGLFATHPPLTHRIRAIDPSFDGDFSKIESRVQKPLPDPEEKIARMEKPQGANIGRDQFIAQVGNLAGITLASATSALESIPKVTREQAHDPESAQALVCALLLDQNPSVRNRQEEAIEARFGTHHSSLAQSIVGVTEKLDRKQRLTVLDLALPTLKHFAANERAAFHQVVDKLIRANDQVSLFEFAVQQLLRRYVPLSSASGIPRVADFHAIKPLADDIALLLATLADSGHADQTNAAEQAYRAGTNRIDEVRSVAKPEVSGLQTERVAAALDHLSKASLPICKRIIEACVETAGFDGTIDLTEAELLRAISATLDCPIPPMVGTPTTKT